MERSIHGTGEFAWVVWRLFIVGSQHNRSFVPFSRSKFSRLRVSNHSFLYLLNRQTLYTKSKDQIEVGGKMSSTPKLISRRHIPLVFALMFSVVAISNNTKGFQFDFDEGEFVRTLWSSSSFRIQSRSSPVKFKRSRRHWSFILIYLSRLKSPYIFRVIHDGKGQAAAPLNTDE